MKIYIPLIICFLQLYTSLAHSVVYDYDKLHQLKKAYYPSSGQTIEYTYDAAGNLRTVNPLHVPDAAPKSVSLSASPSNGTWLVNENIQFSATPLNFPADNPIQRYEWDFNHDGVVDRTTTSSSTNYSYTQAGSYLASVNAIDSQGSQISDQISLIIRPIVTVDKGILSLNLSRSSITEGETANATVKFDRTSVNARNVTLSSAGESVTMPSGVTVAANTYQTSFSIQTSDNNLVDGNRTLTVTASSSEAQNNSTQASLTIADNDTLANGIEIVSVNLDGGSTAIADQIALVLAVTLKNNTSQRLSNIPVNVGQIPDGMTFRDGTTCTVSIDAGATKICRIYKIDIDDLIRPGNYSLPLSGNLNGFNFSYNWPFTVENTGTPDFVVSMGMKDSFERNPGESVQYYFTSRRYSHGYWQGPTNVKTFIQQEGQPDSRQILTSDFFDYKVDNEHILDFDKPAPMVPGRYEVWAEIYPSLDSNLNNNVSAKTIMTVIDPNASEPIVHSVSPTAAILGEKTIFSIAGENLPNDLVFSLTGCDGITREAGASATQIRFSCTLNGSAGTRQGLVNAVDGKQLKAFVIQATEPPRADLVMTVANPATISADTFSQHTVTLTNTGDSVAENVRLYFRYPADTDTETDNWKSTVIALNTTQGESNCPISVGEARILRGAGCGNVPLAGQTLEKLNTSFSLESIDAGKSVTVEIVMQYQGYLPGENIDIEVEVSTDSEESDISNNFYTQTLQLAADQITASCDYDNMLWVSPYARSDENKKPVHFNTLLRDMDNGYALIGFSLPTENQQTVLIASDGSDWSLYPDYDTLPNSIIKAVSMGTAESYLGVSYDGGIYKNTQSGFKNGGGLWAEVAIPVNTPLQDIEQAQGTYIAVGKNGVILHSTDGESWQQAVSHVVTDLAFVDFGNDEFIAGGKGTLLRSTDGITWEILYSTVSSDVEYGATWNGREYLVFDDEGHNHVITANIVDIPYAVPFPPTVDGQIITNTLWHRVSWVDGQYIALTSHGLLSSNDGRSWQTRYQVSDSFYPYEALRTENRFIMAGAYGGVWLGACKAPQPRLNSVTPLTATEGEQVVFTITGDDLPKDLALSVDNCNNSEKLAGSTRFKTQFSCIPESSGSLNGSIKTGSGGELLHSFVVEVEPRIIQADLSIEQNDSSDPVYTDEEVTYTITIKNLSDDNATDVVIENTLPPGINQLPTITHDGIDNCSLSGHVITCDTATLAAQQQATLNIRIAAPSVAATITNIATVSSSTSDPDISNNSSTETTQVLLKDTDNDGIGDSVDNCPVNANADQKDTDADGIGDVCDSTPTGDTDNDGIDNAVDNCPVNANVDQKDTDNDGIGDACDSTPTGDTDNDGIDNTVDNCPANANADQKDTDNDGIGDACDSTPTGDTDNDGIDNAVDNCPANANADQKDTDADGIGDVCDDTPGEPTDVIPPVVEAPDNLILASKQLKTRFDFSLFGTANAQDDTDGTLTPVLETIDGKTPIYRNGKTQLLLKPGRHTFLWTATDAAGNKGSASQQVDVLPKASFMANQSGSEGQTLLVDVVLNGSAPQYPVSIPFTVRGANGLPASSDIRISTNSIIINQPSAGEQPKGSLSVELLDDGIAETNETITFNMSVDDIIYAIPGRKLSHKIKILAQNVPPRIKGVPVTQTIGDSERKSRRVYQADGIVTVTARATDPNGDNLSYSWYSNTLADLTPNNDSFEFDPMQVSAGHHTVSVDISDGLHTVSRTKKIRIKSGSFNPPNNLTLDTDGDGILDKDETGDNNENGISDWLEDNNQLSSDISIDGDKQMSTTPGLVIGLGDITMQLDNPQKTQITEADITNYLSNQGLTYQADNGYTPSMLLDYVIDGIEIDGTGSGQNIAVAFNVNPLPSNTVIRKYNPNTQTWSTFTENAYNSIASFRTTNDNCPDTDSSSYQTGLHVGANCIRLIIQDGGPNDTDGNVNGIIEDPLAVSTKNQASNDDSTPADTSSDNSPENSGGGGVVSPLILLLLGFLLLIIRSKKFIIKQIK